MKKTSATGKIAGSLSLAAAGVAAIAAGYYFYGKGGKGHRKEAGNWTKEAKMEILQKIKQMKDVTEAAYQKALNEVLSKYKLVKNIDPAELQNFGKELKAHWEEISKEAAKLTNKGRDKKSAAVTP
jgi:hypothetical protein